MTVPMSKHAAVTTIMGFLPSTSFRSMETMLANAAARVAELTIHSASITASRISERMLISAPDITPVPNPITAPAMELKPMRHRMIHVMSPQMLAAADSASCGLAASTRARRDSLSSTLTAKREPNSQR